MVLVVDLRTMRVLQTAQRWPMGPDVLAWDAAWRRLYVAGEGGALQAFWLDGMARDLSAKVRAPHAHTVARSIRELTVSAALKKHRRPSPSCASSRY